MLYISEQLGLIGNSEESIKMLLSKSKFRELQKKAGVYTLESDIISTLEELFKAINIMKLPVIVKPTESSGTRGTQRIDELNEKVIRDSFEMCSEFLRNNLVSVEECVEM